MNHVDPSKSSSTSPPRKVQRAFTGLAGRDIEPARNTAEPAVNGNVIDEDKLRQQLGIGKTEKRVTLPDSYRALLQLDPQDIIDFFDVEVDQKENFEQVDFIVPRSIVEHRVTRLKRVIAASKAVIEGMPSHIIKIRRGKDDPLLDDKAAREKYKRDENARIARCNVKLFLYRAALNKELHQKIWRLVTKPVYFRDVADDHIVFRTVTDVRWTETDKLFTGGLQTHTRVELFEYLRLGSVDLESYRAVMTLGEAALTELGEAEAEQKEMWDNIRKWENTIIVEAVRHRVIVPRRDLAELLGLGSILDERDLGYIGSDAENKLAIKTGGACYGGRIKSEGFRYSSGKPVPRALSSFDKPLRSIVGNGGEHQDAGFGSLKDINDDVEAYDPEGKSFASY